MAGRLVRCAVCGYHYEAASMTVDLRCADERRCAMNRSAQAQYRLVDALVKAEKGRR